MKAAFIFPGQGSQKTGMGRDLYENSPIAKKLLDQASHELDIDFSQLLFEKDERLSVSKFTQPAIMLVSLMALRTFQNESKLQPKMVFGHSLGEFSALACSGTLEDIAGLKLVHERGSFMQDSGSDQEHGMMVVLGLDDAKVESICQQQQEVGMKMWPANYNCDGQMVVAGVRGDLQASEALFKEQGAKRAMLLDMSVASHCPLMEEAASRLGEKLTEVLSDSFATPVISNVTAKPYQTKAEALELIQSQLVKPVRYKHSVQSVENEVDCFIEFGHGKVLQGLNKRIASKPTYVVHDIASLQETLQNL